MAVDGSFELALEGYPVLGSVKPRSTETYLFQPFPRGSQYANGFPQPSEKHEPDPVSPQHRGPPRTEVSSHPESGISNSRVSVPSVGIVAEESSNSISGVDRKR